MSAEPSSPQRSETSYRRAVLLLVAVAAALRLFLASTVDPSGFEAMIWVSERNPALIGFGFVALRLPLLLFGSASTLLLYRWTREMSGPAVGWVAACLHSLAFLFMNPVATADAPLFFFWLLAAYSGWKGFHPDVPTSRERLWILFLGLPLGLALLSGNAAWLLIAGFAGYLASDPIRRAWLKRPEPWIALAFAVMLTFPVLYWHYQHGWTPFRPQFHRLHLLSLVAPFVYLNPPVAVSIVAGVAALAKRRPAREDSSRFLCWISIPAVLFPTLFSFFDPSSDLQGAGAGFLTLIPVAAIWLQPKVPLRWAALVLGGLLALAASVNASLTKSPWRDLEPGLKGLQLDDAALLFALRAPDAALAEYHAGRRAVCLGDPDEARWLATSRPPEFRRGCSGYLILSGADLKETDLSWRARFKSVGAPHSIEKTLEGETRERFRVYRCEGLVEDPTPLYPGPDLRRPEYRLFFAVNRGLRSGVADVLIGGSNWLGVGYVGGPLALLIAAWQWRRHPERRTRDLIGIAGAALLCTMIVQPMKFGCARERPPKVFESAIRKGDVDLHVMFGAKQGRGFPSGHTATAFMIATLVALILGRRVAAAVAFGLALLVGVSTMYIGAHFPGDVVAGAWVGTITALTAFRAAALAKAGDAAG